MALLLGQCHSVLLMGNLLLSNKLVIRLPFQDIRSNLWQIAINEISIHTIKELNILSGISCNFVTDICYHSTNEIINFHPILWQVLIKGNKSEKKTFRLDKSWFYVNNSYDELELSFFVLEDGQINKAFVPIDCEIYVTILLQRVK